MCSCTQVYGSMYTYVYLHAQLTLYVRTVNFALCTHSVANLKMAAQRRNHYSNALTLSGIFPDANGKTM